MRRKKMFPRLSIFWTTILTFVGVYLFLLIGVPYLSMLITGRDTPLPIPSTLMAIYLALTLIGLLVYLAADGNKLKEFWSPVDAFLSDTKIPRERADYLPAVVRWVVLLAIPLLAGWVMYNRVAPSSTPSAALRTQ